MFKSCVNCSWVHKRSTHYYIYSDTYIKPRTSTAACTCTRGHTDTINALALRLHCLIRLSRWNCGVLIIFTRNPFSSMEPWMGSRRIVELGHCRNRYRHTIHTAIFTVHTTRIFTFAIFSERTFFVAVQLWFMVQQKRLRRMLQ